MNNNKQPDQAFYCNGCQDMKYCAENRVCLIAQQPWPNKQPGTGQEWKEAFKEWYSSRYGISEDNPHLDSHEYEDGKESMKIIIDWFDAVVTPLQSQLQQAQAEIKRLSSPPSIAEEAGMKWVKASDNMPEYNRGVLVFIPDEDFHITSGMWDISNKWVLLDECRHPECEVTHWMPLPSMPDEYKKEQQENEDAMLFLKKHLTPPAPAPEKAHSTEIEYSEEEVKLLTASAFGAGKEAGLLWSNWWMQNKKMGNAEKAHPSASKEEAPIREEESIEQKALAFFPVYIDSHHPGKDWNLEKRRAWILGYKAATPPQPQQIEDKDKEAILQGLKFSLDKISEMRKTNAGLGPIEHGVRMAYNFLTALKASPEISKEQIDERIEEIWDEFSQQIGGDIDDLEYFAHRTVIQLSGFKKAIHKILAQYRQSSPSPIPPKTK